MGKSRALNIALAAAFGITLSHWLHTVHYETPAQIVIRFAEAFLGAFLVVVLLEFWHSRRNQRNSPSEQVR
jgi:hypothetical protein